MPQLFIGGMLLNSHVKGSSVDFDFNNFIRDVRSITKALSFARILKLFSLSIVVIIMYSIHERRSDFFNLFLEPLIINSTEPIDNNFEISKKDTERLTVMLQKTPGVVGIAVVSVDVRQNLKTIKLKLLDKKIEDQLMGLPSQSPLFTDNGEMNNRTVILMSGEIYCMNSNKQNLGSILPGMEKIFPFSCSIPIPPSYGNFSGWLFVGFDRTPNQREFNSFKNEVTQISASIKKGG